IEVVAVSADSQAQASAHKEELQVSFPIGYGLTLEDMKKLGVYISVPRSEQETDHDFSEPALFIVNEKGQLHVVDIANNPFIRPELEQLTKGLAWIKNPDNNYPIRGTYHE
ncbi:MAG: peroxiredoxin family protein, partial [Vibrio sp.]